jgi:hypothetical protein
MSISYTVDNITNNVAKVRFDNGSFIYVELKSDWTEAEFDEQVLWQAPPEVKGGSGTPSFLSEGASRTAAEQPAPAAETPTWLDNRIAAYGTAEEQIEYITENGLSAWQTKVTQIKTDNPKPSE